MASEDYVQVPPDSSGKKVKTFSAIDVNGNTVEVQGVVVIDKDGLLQEFSSAEQTDLLRGILREMQALRRMYGRATGQAAIGFDAASDDIA